jgi:AcrR family transcriptional regulator
MSISGTGYPVGVCADAPRRVYRSPTRRQAAERTRRRILEAARALMRAHGYQAATLRSIAARAGVAPQTVVATFGSKPRILAELIRRQAFGARHADLIRQIEHAPTPHEQVALLAAINRQVYEAGQPELELLHAAAGTAPELQQVRHDLDAERREGQRITLDRLAERGALDAAGDLDALADLVWALSSYEVYRALVVDSGWPPDRYESHMAALLVRTVLGPRA